MITTIISFIIVLGVLVTVHELGHFLVAKAFGIGVERFSVGFPPKMFGYTWGETEYCISWIPLGGYVKLKGEGPEEEMVDLDDPTLFSSRPPLQRAGVIMAGPVLNLILAFIIMPLVFIVGISVPAYLEKPAQIGWVEKDSMADRAGFTRGDTITALDGKDIDNWGSLFERFALYEKGTLEVSVIKDGNRRSLQLDLDSMKDDVPLGIFPHIDPVVGSLTPGFPAQAAGVEPGDTILSVGGTPFTHWNEMAQMIHSSPGKPLTIEVRREGSDIKFEVTPRQDEKSGKGMVGISPRTESNIKSYPVAESIKRGFNYNIDRLRDTFGLLGKLFTFKASIKNLGGPIMIFQITGKVARAGVADFLAFMAFLSLQLGILNLLPIPVLDGGHLIFLGAEGALGKPIKPQALAMAQRVGFFLLILLILVISYNDVVRLLANR